MKIERIADNAINIYISGKDLASRNLDVSTLKEGTHDFDKLIWDAIDHANIEFGHEFEDRQLNVVNKPDGTGGLILMISHDVDEDYEDNFYYDEENEKILSKFDKILKNAAKNVRNENKNVEPAADTEEQEEDSGEGEDAEDAEYEAEDEEDGDEEESASAEQQEASIFDMSNIPPEAFRNLFHKILVQNRNQKVAQPQHAAGKKQEKQDQASGTAATPIKFIQPARKSSMLSDWDVLIFPEFNDMLEFFSRNKSFKTDRVLPVYLQRRLLSCTQAEQQESEHAEPLGIPGDRLQCDLSARGILPAAFERARHNPHGAWGDFQIDQPF